MRHVSSTSNAVDLFGRVLEDIIRTRMQNKIPTILATNSPNPLDSFTGALKASLTSLMNYVEVITVLGRDFRKDGK